MISDMEVIVAPRLTTEAEAPFLAADSDQQRYMIPTSTPGMQVSQSQSLLRITADSLFLYLKKHLSHEVITGVVIMPSCLKPKCWGN